MEIRAGPGPRAARARTPLKSAPRSWFDQRQRLFALARADPHLSWAGAPFDDSRSRKSPTASALHLVANHASHLDAVILAGMLPARYVGNVFPIAAGDTFFTKPATSIFATAFMNALPIWRNSCGTHSLDELRNRLTSGNCIYIFSPKERARATARSSRSSRASAVLVAGTSLPVVPCYLHGTFMPCPHRAVCRGRARFRRRLVSRCNSKARQTIGAAGTELPPPLENAVRRLSNSLGSCPNAVRLVRPRAWPRPCGRECEPSACSCSTLSGFFRTVIGPFVRMRSSMSLSG